MRAEARTDPYNGEEAHEVGVDAIRGRRKVAVAHRRDRYHLEVDLIRERPLGLKVSVEDAADGKICAHHARMPERLEERESDRFGPSSQAKEQRPLLRHFRCVER